MASLDAFLPLVRGHLPGCPEMILRDAIRDACVSFCMRTRLTVESVDISVSAGERFAEALPLFGVAAEVLELRRGGVALRPSDRGEFAALALDTSVGSPGYFYLDGDGRLVLGPIPEAPELLVATLVTRPRDDDTDVADVLYSDWREAIAAAARAWVRRHYGQWIEPQLEADDRQFFDDAVARACHWRARGRTGKPLRTRAYFF